ncbi:MAG: hypothetical protein ACRD50_16925 [Candidatus Acidiferrales bacterium]
MEGPLIIPPNRPERQPERACGDCGQFFRPRPVGDGYEELCDTCFTAQFEPRHIRKWEKISKRSHALKMPAVARVRRERRSWAWPE